MSPFLDPLRSVLVWPSRRRRVVAYYFHKAVGAYTYERSLDLQNRTMLAYIHPLADIHDTKSLHTPSVVIVDAIGFLSGLSSAHPVGAHYSLTLYLVPSRL